MPQAMPRVTKIQVARRLTPRWSLSLTVKSIYDSCMRPSSRDFTIDVRRLRVLREVERRGTVSAAAGALHLTPSAVSQQLAGLSRDLGVPLLVKQGRGVRLTGQAHVLLEHAALVEEQLDRARADLEAWGEGIVGHGKVGGLSTGIAALV